jgi:NADH:ubiquinone oxidoreductase subunit 6 (subunit J)
MTYEISLVLGVMLVGVTLVALVIRKLVWSLILLFYSSIIFGILLMTFGATFAGLFHIVTFAGAVSVLFMVILMIVGEQALSEDKPGKQHFAGVIIAVLVAVPFVLLASNFTPLSSRIDEQSQLAELPFQTNGPLGFLWVLRSWDLLLVVIVVAAAMLGVMNLFSREGGVEK